MGAIIFVFFFSFISRYIDRWLLARSQIAVSRLCRVTASWLYSCMKLRYAFLCLDSSLVPTIGDKGSKCLWEQKARYSALVERSML